MNLQNYNYMQNSAFVAKVVNVRLTKICMAIIALAEILPTSATLIFSPHFFSFTIEFYIYETDFALSLIQQYHF